MEIEHFPWCAHIQNMARPRSQRLIGPMCECAKLRKVQDDLKRQIDSGELDYALGITDGDKADQ